MNNKPTFLVSLTFLAAMSVVGCQPTAVPAAPAPLNPSPAASTEAEVAAPEYSRLPLSDFGPHLVGMMRLVKLADPSQPDHKVLLTIWYPAAAPAGTEPWQDAKSDAAPDRSGAPYPLILTATTFGSSFAPHLASHGFVVAGMDGQNWSDSWGPWLIDHPREMLFALDQIATQGISGLDGMIDSDNVGAMGYSFGSVTALSLGGARVDPETYRARCAQVASIQPTPPQAWSDYVCNLRGGWDAFEANAGPEITAGADGLWAPITDDRIRAVVAMAPEGAFLFGERGLKALGRPTLLFGATEDLNNDYELEAAQIFQGLNETDRTMVSFIGEPHMMIDAPGRLAQMQHFAAAFFALHLKGDEGMAAYVSQDFVDQFDDLAWGVYTRP